MPLPQAHASPYPPLPTPVPPHPPATAPSCTPFPQAHTSTHTHTRAHTHTHTHTHTSPPPPCYSPILRALAAGACINTTFNSRKAEALQAAAHTLALGAGAGGDAGGGGAPRRVAVSVLHCAVSCGSVEVCELLLQNSAGAWCVCGGGGGRGGSASAGACVHVWVGGWVGGGQVWATPYHQTLPPYPPPPPGMDLVDGYGRTPLHYCILYDAPLLAKQLLKRGAQGGVRDVGGASAWDLAVGKGRLPDEELFVLLSAAG